MAKKVVTVNVHSWDSEFEMFTRLVEIAGIMPGPVGEQLRDLLLVNAVDVVARDVEREVSDASASS